jgi:hypothetical protein
MTAPGHEPDEILTAKPQGPSDEGSPQDEIGDAHMPEDLREKQREDAAQEEASESE